MVIDEAMVTTLDVARLENIGPAASVPGEFKVEAANGGAVKAERAEVVPTMNEGIAAAGSDGFGTSEKTGGAEYAATDGAMAAERAGALETATDGAVATERAGAVETARDGTVADEVEGSVAITRLRSIRSERGGGGRTKVRKRVGQEFRSDTITD